MGRPLSSPFSVELGFSFDKWLGDNLSLWRNAVMNQDIDCFVLVDGKEGSGKSVHALQIAHFLDVDRNINIDKQVCFTPDEVKKAITNLPKFKAIVYDEAKRGLNRRRSTENTNIELTELFAECRQNNLFLVVVLPAFHDLDMNVAVFRSRVLINVYYRWNTSTPNEPLVRGYARFYNEAAKKYLYTNKHIRQNYLHPRHKDSFDYRFPHHYVVDEALYRKKKKQAVQDFNVKKKTKSVPEAIEFLKSKDLLKSGAIKIVAEEYLNMPLRTFGHKRAEASKLSADIRKKTGS